jgi:hypothetical protein
MLYNELVIYIGEYAGPKTLFTLSLCNRELNRRKFQLCLIFSYIEKNFGSREDLVTSNVRQVFVSNKDYIKSLSECWDEIIIPKHKHHKRLIWSCKTMISIFPKYVDKNSQHQWDNSMGIINSAHIQYRVTYFQYRILVQQKRRTILALIY